MPLSMSFSGIFNRSVLFGFRPSILKAKHREIVELLSVFDEIIDVGADLLNQSLRPFGGIFVEREDKAIGLYWRYWPRGRHRYKGIPSSQG